MALSGVSITAARTSGLAPLAIFFECAATSSLYSYEFHELFYVWSFGDPSAGIWTVSGRSKNQAIGPVAGHVFESAGTYTVRCTVYEYNDSGSLVDSAYDEETITVTDVWSEIYVVSNNTDFTGAPTGGNVTQKPNVTDWATVASYKAANRQILLHPGHTWTHTGNVSWSFTGPGYVGPWGAGTKPRVEITGGTNPKSVTMASGGDVRFVDLTFDGGSVNNAMAFYTGYGFVQDDCANQVTILRCDVEYAHGLHRSWSPQQVDLAIVDCVASNMEYSTEDDKVFGLRSGRLIFQGNICLDCSSSGHGMRNFGGLETHGGVVQHCRIHKCGTNKSLIYQISTDGGYGATEQYSKLIYSDNDFWLGTQGFSYNDDTCHFSSSNDVSHENDDIWDILFERNAVGLGYRGLRLGYRDTTVRNNIFWVKYAGPQVTKNVGMSDPDNVRIYNNTVYCSEVPGNFYAVRWSSYSTGNYVRNIYGSAPNVVGGKGALENSAGASITASNNTLTDTPGWVVWPSPSDPDDFKLDTGAAGIDAGTYDHNVRLDYGVNDRFAGSVGSSFDQGAWERGATEFQNGGGGGNGDTAVQPVPASSDYTVFLEF